MQLEFITPKSAKEILDKSAEAGFSNRNPNKNNIVKLSKMMKAGFFHGELAEPIAITKSGELINGQHRLLAVIDSDTTQQMIVAKDADPEAFKHLDNVVKPRTNADILKIAGYQYAAEKAAAMRIVDMYRMQSSQFGGQSNIVGYEIIDMIDNYGDDHLNELAKAASVLHSNKFLRVSVSLACLAIGFEDDKTNRDRLSEWVDGIAKLKGIYSSGHDPRAMLANYGLNNQGRNSNQTTFIEDYNMYATCWNKWLAGSEMKRVPSVSRGKGFIALSPSKSYSDDRP